MTSADPRMRLWTVYDHPTDAPDLYVARRFTIGADGTPQADHIAFFARELAAIRRMLTSVGLICITRDPNDDPNIMETWL